MSVFFSPVQPKIFWATIVVVSMVFLLVVFSQNYALDQETKIIFADVAQGVIRPEKPAIDTSAWKIYENKKLGFSLKYPPKFQVFPCYGQMLFCLNVGEKNLAFQDNGFAVRIYDVAKLRSHDEIGFIERQMNGVTWRVKQDLARAFRTDFGSTMQIRVFATSSYSMLDSIVATFGFVK